MLKRARSVAAVGLVLLLPAAAYAAGERTATEPTKPAVTSGGIPESERPYLAVNDAVDRVNRVLDAQAIADQVALSVTYDPDSITAYTQIPADSAAMRLAAKASAPILLTVQPTKFSVEQLTKEGARLSRQEPGVASAGPTDDYSAVQVSLRSSSDTLAGLGIKSVYPLVQVASSSPAVANRSDDVKPVYGGALVTNNVTGTSCSSGIGVSVGGVQGFTIAEHCDTGTYHGWGNSSNVGTAYSSGAASAAKDIRFVQANATSGRIWTGAWNGITSELRYATSAPANNQRICGSGGITGETCGDTYVRGTNQSSLGTSPGFWVLTEIVVNNVQRCVVNRGDSGSPVYNYVSNGSLEVRGFMVQSDGSFSTGYCPNMNPSFAKNIYTSSRGFAVNAPAALSAIGATAQ